MYVYILTDDTGELEVAQRFYVSNNYGENFRDDTSKISGELDDSDRKFPNIIIAQFFINKDNPQKVLLRGEGKYYWLTTDAGHSYKQLESPFNTYGQYHIFKTHPSKADWILGRVTRSECLSGFMPQPWSAGCAADLVLTQDFGESWQNLTENAGGDITGFQDFEWGVYADGDVEDDSIPEQTIFATAFTPDSKSASPFGQWQTDLNFYRSKDFFKKNTQEVKCGNLFEIVGKTVFLARPSWCPYDINNKPRSTSETTSNGKEIDLFISIDDGQTFEPSCIPKNSELQDKSFNLVGTHDGKGAYVIAEQQDTFVQTQAKTSTVYSPGYDFPNVFAESLVHCHKDHQRTLADFQRVEGMPGLIVANQDIGSDWTNVNNPQIYPDYFKNSVATRMSYSGGALWDFIKSPSSFSYSECNNCRGRQNKCYLHLYGQSKWQANQNPRPSIYSQNFAPGILIGSGNTAPEGQGLSNDIDKICTWLSNDGGITWRDVAPDPYIYEYGDFGNIIVMATYEAQGVADYVYFSVDAGLTWSALELSQSMFIRNIRVEPNGNSRRFLIHGRACRRSKKFPTCSLDMDTEVIPGLVYTVDVVDKGNLRTCGSGDMYKWTLPDDVGCVNGNRIEYERKNNHTKCYVDKSDDVLDQSVSTCECDINRDFECDYGFTEKFRNDSDSSQDSITRVCQKETDTLSTCPLIKDNVYKVSDSGMRLVFGDQCSNPETIVKDTNARGCDSDGHCSKVGPHGKSGRSGHGGWGALWAFLIIAFLSVGFYVWYARYAPPAAREMIEKICIPIINCIMQGVEFVRAQIQSCMGRVSQRGAYRQGYESYEPLGSGPQLYDNRNQFR